MLKKIAILLSPDAAAGGGAAKPDQADILAQNTQLTADLAASRLSVTSLQGNITTLTAEKNTLQTRLDAATASATVSATQVTAITAENTTLKAENATLKAEKTTVEAGVAAKLAALGITDTKAAAAAPNTEGKKLTLTAKILEARGCKTLDELHAKMEETRAKAA